MGRATGRRWVAGTCLLMLALAACDGIPATATSASRATTNVSEIGSGDEVARVVKVTDGDTIRVLFADGSEEPVRLIGIDAPEQGGDLATQATAYLSDLVADHEVHLVIDVSDRDRFGRLLRYVYAGEVFVNEAIVLAGLAVAERYEPDTAMAIILEQAQQEAQDRGVGMWAPTAANAALPVTTLALASE